MQTILLPTDFSENARHAARFAVLLAMELPARIRLLHVYDFYIPLVEEEPEAIARLVQLKEAKAQQDLDDFRRDLASTTQFPLDQLDTCLWKGSVPDSIVETARTENAAYVVMGTQGARRTLDRWLGTVTQSVCLHAPCPVWVIPVQAPVNVPKRILYAADLERDETTAVQEVIDFAKIFGAAIRVLHLHPYHELPVGELMHGLREHFQDQPVEFRNLKRDDIIEAIETYSQQTYHPDMLALAVYRKSFLEQFLIDSVTSHFVQTSERPVLIVQKHS